LKIHSKIIICLLILITQIGNSQFSGIDLLDGKKKKEISFDYINGYILLDVIYGGILHLNFILDTGASHNILLNKRTNDLLGIAYTDTINIKGSDLVGNLTALVCRNVPIMLQNTEAIQRDIIVLKEDYLDLNMVLGKRVDGILGGDFFKGLIIGLDYEKQKLTVYNPKHFKSKKNTVKTDIKIINYKPYIKCATKIRNSLDTLTYLLDTGASLPLLLQDNINKTFEKPHLSILGNLGRGLSGELTGYLGMLNNIQFSEFELANVLTSFQSIDSLTIIKKVNIRDGLVGNDILSRFHIHIDYVNEILYLKPYKGFKEKFDYDKSGLLIYAVGKNQSDYRIHNVYPNTPSAEAGLKKGDIILKVGWLPLRFYSLSSIKQKLQGKEGKKIKMKILRGDQKLNFEFRLRDFFKSEK